MSTQGPNLVTNGVSNNTVGTYNGIVIGANI